MTRAPALSSCSGSAEVQIDTAVLRLVDLFARQVARELAADAPDAKEAPNGTDEQQDD